MPYIASLARPNQIPRLPQFAAQFAGNLVNLSEIGRSVALDHKTTTELLKLSSVSEERVSLFYFRDRDQNEVDFVLQNAEGHNVGIEVKAAATVTRRDFAGLDRLASIAAHRFVQGILLYDGERPLSFAENLPAAPFASVWA